MITLKMGSVGEEVRDLQNKLLGLGFRITVDGKFGSETYSVVKEFQRQNGLTVDGVVGTVETWPAIISAYNSKIGTGIIVPASPTSPTQAKKPINKKIIYGVGGASVLAIIGALIYKKMKK